MTGVCLYQWPDGRWLPIVMDWYTMMWLWFKHGLLGPAQSIITGHAAVWLEVEG